MIKDNCSRKELLICGFMSGTSMDGIDVVFSFTNGIDKYETLKFKTFSYSKKTNEMLKSSFFKDLNHLNNKVLINEISHLITHDHFKAYKDMCKTLKSEPKLIGFHGQTIFHNPKEKKTVQLGEPQLLSNLTKTKVISDFRHNDLNGGGEGAPISPIFHKYIYEKLKFNYPVCFLNIGGVSNLTFCSEKELIAFDTGPGSGMIDIVCQKHFNLPFDKNGEKAFKGKVCKSLLERLLQNPYFDKNPPKSLDKLFISELFKKDDFNKINHFDKIKTLSELTIKSVVNSFRFFPKKPELLLVMGGGRKNKYFMKRINEELNIKVKLIDFFEFDGDQIEADLISFLTARSYYDFPFTFPSTTGVLQPTKGGKIYYPIK